MAMLSLSDDVSVSIEKRRNREVTLSSMSPVKKICSMNDNFLVHLPSVHPGKVISSKKNHTDDFRHHIFAGNWPEK